MAIKPKGYSGDPDTGEILPILIMDKAEILEREELNIANTSGLIRARVLRQLATTNGHGAISTQ